MTPTVGTLLREARLRQRLSIAECVRRTHVSSRYLEALEADNWETMPSDSHTEGFLKIYARSLGVPVEDAVGLYREARRVESLEEPKSEPGKVLSASRPQVMFTGQQIAWLVGLSLVIGWMLYHAFFKSGTEQRTVQWFRNRRPTHTRLTPVKRETLIQRIAIRAQQDSWLRVVDNQHMIFEGTLPAGSAKEWSGPGPFHIKSGNINAISVYWNDQPVDLKSGARGTVNSVRLPPMSK